jgi:hypothetical protein
MSNATIRILINDFKADTVEKAEEFYVSCAGIFIKLKGAALSSLLHM